MSETERKPTTEVQQQILEKFVKELEGGDVSAAVIDRLRETVSGSLSETELRKALFSEDAEA
jgi:hypothetical protein